MQKKYSPYMYQNCEVGILREDLKSFLRSNKIPEAQFAKKARVSQITLSMFLRNGRDTRAENVAKIRSAFLILLSKTKT